MLKYNSLFILISALLTIGNCVEWYDKEVLYQIYPKSFADSDGDGIGDLKGITNNAKHFKDIGVGAVWLSPIFTSPMKDNGYDISNYTDINPMFGTLDDFKALIKAFHDLGIKVLLDLVPNHTSEECEWFKDSIARKNGKDEFYVWRDADKMDPSGNREPPNNWASLFGGSAWTYNEARNQFYLHQFGSYQPDLNFRNKDVIAELKNIMRYWLDMGVDGFRVDAVPYLVEDEKFDSEPQIPNCKPENSYDCLVHNKTRDMPDTFKVLEDLGTVFKEDKYKNTPRKLFLEAYADIPNTMKYYSENAMPFNFQLLQVQRDWNASQLENLINTFMNAMPASTNTTEYRTIWVIGNHDNSRVGSRMGEDMIDAMNMLVFMAPGNTVTYYGEEIGMVDTYLKANEQKDTRDPERTPMQWNDKLSAGFSNTSNTWLPVNPNYWEVNKEKEMADKNSHLSVYKKLTALQNDLIDNTKNYSTHVISKWVFGLSRLHYMLIINLDDRDQKVNLTNSLKDIPSSLTVKVASLNSAYNDGDSVKAEEVMLRPRSGIIFHTGSAVMNTVSILLFISMIILHLY